MRNALIGVLAGRGRGRRNSPAYTGCDERLAALRAGRPVDVPVSALPRWARPGEELRWWRRATVSPDGTAAFYDDDGTAWLAEQGL